MQYVAAFEKVSKSVFEQSAPISCYSMIKIPHRSTKGSAGYDFVTPISIELLPGDSIVIPTGIRVKIAQGYVLFLLPRSGLGFKYSIKLCNTVGVIDSDYYDAKNEGHILVKMANPSKERFMLNAGERFCQGIFLPYFLAEETDDFSQRIGGFGSTGLL